MLALTAVWMGMISLFLSLAMLMYRPAFNDLTVTAVLWFGVPGAICLAGLTLWAYRDEGRDDLGIVARRIQAKLAIVLSFLAAGIVYVLIIFSTKLDPVARFPRNEYNSRCAAFVLRGTGPSLPLGVPIETSSRQEVGSCACG